MCKNAPTAHTGVRSSKLARQFGPLALATLLVSGPASLIAADRSRAGEVDRLGLPSAEATRTATSSLALLHPVRTLTVTTAEDAVDPGDGKLSLREAVDLANETAALDAINFAASLEGTTLVLSGGQLEISEDLRIDGDSEGDGARTRIESIDHSRSFEITGASTDVALAKLTITTSGPYAYGGYNGGAVRHLGRSLVIADSTLNSRCAHGDDDYRGCNGGAIYVGLGSQLTITGSHITGSGGFGGGIFSAGEVDISESTLLDSHAKAGGAIFLHDGTASIYRSAITDNSAASGGGISVGDYFGSGRLVLNNSTVVNNRAYLSFNGYGNSGGGIDLTNGNVTIVNSTITGNNVEKYSGGYAYEGYGGAIHNYSDSELHISNSIVAGNGLLSRVRGPDIDGAITSSNGHNVFGSDVAGNIAGDRENVAPGALFAAVDPETRGGKLSASGIVPLKIGLANPALSGADPLAAPTVGQLGTTRRPRPAGSLPDIGSIEIDQPLSTGPTVNNDVITGSAAANRLRGMGGNDLIRALGGNDMVSGEEGSDVLDGGTGNNRLDGGTGVDLVTFAFSSVPVVVVLGGAAGGTARRGADTDRLIGIEGVIGTAKADRFTGNARDNWFQGGLGRDLATGGGGRDIYVYDRVKESPAGATARDVIADFAPGKDVLDLSRIDADQSAPGDQAFHWIGNAPLTGVGQLGYVFLGDNTIICASTDADAAPEFEIQLTGRKALTKADFRL